MSFRPVFIAVRIGSAPINAAFLVNSRRPGRGHLLLSWFVRTSMPTSTRGL